MTRERPIRSFLPAATALWLLVALPAFAQEGPLPDLFSDVIDVRVVNVEVVVTDRKGNRIQGLEPGDFELLVDGTPTPISYFTEVDDGLARATADDGIGSVPALAAEEPVGTNYLIFVDDLFAIAQRRNRVLDHLAQDLDRLGPADRVAVVAFDGRELDRLTDWTNSLDEIENALVRARERKALGLENKFGLGVHTRRSVMAAAGTLRSFADAPGRKVMLLLADGWDTLIDLWNPRSLWVTRFQGDIATGLSDLYAPLVHAANLVGYSLYPIDVAGPRPGCANRLGPIRRSDSLRDRSGSRSPREDAVLANEPSVNQGTGCQQDAEFDTFAGTPEGLPPSERRWHDVLQYLADETGGLPMINSFSNKALAETAADTRSYYWLGFDPPRNEDDQLHDIEVRVAGRQGLRARAREHYLDMSKATETTMLVEGSLLFGGSPGAQSVEVRFGSPRKAGFRKLFVPMEVTVPLEDLELLPLDGRWRNELEFQITLMNEFGDLSSPPARKIPVVAAREPAAGEVFVYETELRITKGAHRYVAAFFDPLTGAIMSTSGDVGH